MGKITNVIKLNKITKHIHVPGYSYNIMHLVSHPNRLTFFFTHQNKTYFEEYVYSSR